MKQITITQGFKQGADSAIGKLTFANTENAKALYELLNENPEWFSFEIGYTIDEEGNKQLTEISLVSKHVKNGIRP